MFQYLLWFALALLAAVLVIAAAAFVTTERFGAGGGAAGLRRDARRVWDVVRRRRPATTSVGSPELERVVTAEPVEVTMQDFFAANVTPGSGYLAADELSDQLTRAAGIVRPGTVREVRSDG